MKNIDFDEYLQQANILMAQEKYEEALAYLNKAEKIDDQIADVYIRKGVAFANCEKYEEAKDEFRKALDIDEHNGLVLFHLGNIEILLENKSKGIELYNNAIACGYNNAQIYYSLGLMHEENGEDDLAIRNYSKAIMQDANRSDIRIRKIRTLINNNMLEDALVAVDELRLANPDAYEGYHLRFVILVSLERLDEAEMIIAEAMELFPKDASFAIDKASLMITRGQYDNALEYFNDIQSNMDTDWEIIHIIAMEKARVFSYREDMEKAICALEDAKKVYEEHDLFDTEAVYLLMNCYVAMKDYDNALRMARELKNSDDDSYYILSAYYYEPFVLKLLGNEEEATKLFDESIDFYRNKSLKHPNNIDAYAFRVMSLRELGRLEKALELSDYLISVKDDMAEFHVLKATVLEALGQGLEAQKERDRADELGGVVNQIKKS